jgi:tRNA A37 threonylcarbamoyladenosine dehydratase
LIDRNFKPTFRDYYKWVKENIEYDIITDIGNRQIKSKDDIERIDEIVDVMVDMLFPEKPMVRIGDSEFPHEVVKSRLSKITAEHVIYIIDCLDKNTTKVKNMAAYLRKTIYNAPTTYSNYVVADVNNMMYGD